MTDWVDANIMWENTNPDDGIFLIGHSEESGVFAGRRENLIS
jgi:hypothetical protein